MFLSQTQFLLKNQKWNKHCFILIRISEDQEAVRRHRLAFKLEGVPHLSTNPSESAMERQGRFGLVCKFGPPEG